MKRAYVFPPGPITPQRLHFAESVDLDSDYGKLRRASRSDLLRCPFPGCLGPVTPVRSPGTRSNELRCFSHRPGGASPGCPYVATGGSGTHDPGPTLVMTSLLTELVRRFQGGGVSFGVENLSSRIDVDGLEIPVVIVYVDPANIERLADLDELDGKQVLFVLAVDDLARINEEMLGRLQSRSPVLAIDRRESDTEEDRIRIAPTRRRLPTPPRVELEGLIAEVDLLLLDYRGLFGFERRADYVFIKESHKQAALPLVAALADPALSAAGRKALRLVLKTLLVEGAGIHRAVFRQEMEEALDPYRAGEVFPGEADLPDLAEILAAAADPLVIAAVGRSERARRIFEELPRAAQAALEQRLRGAEEGRRAAIAERDELARAIEERKKAEAKLAAEVERLKKELAAAHGSVDAERRRAADAATKLAEQTDQWRLAESELAAARQREKNAARQLAEVRQRSEALEKDLDELAEHPLGRGVLWLYLRDKFGSARLSDRPWHGPH